ncbi:MAG: gliding motility-associated-like protein [Flavobacteriales bacterium]|jgi:gliding motility-associated-like protein
MKTNVLNHYYPTKNKNFTRFVFSTLLLVFSLCCSAQNMTQTQKHGFIPNQGQLTNTDGHLVPNINYYTKGNMAWYFTKTGWHMVVAKRTGNQSPSVANAEADFDAAQFALDTLQMHRVDVRLKNARIDLTLTAEKPLAHYYNYYYGHCPDGITNVHPYETMTYKNVWDNIDIVFVMKENGPSTGSGYGIEYDFVVHPGGNPNDIQLEYKGQEELELTENQTALNIITPLGNIHETLPAIYQRQPSECQLSGVEVEQSDAEVTERQLSEPVLSLELSEPALNEVEVTELGLSVVEAKPETSLPGYYTLTPTAPNTYQVSFQVPHYNTDLALVIDPWATFVGGSAEDKAFDMDIDNLDRVAITGFTLSDNFPATPGAFQTNKGVDEDIFIATFTETGQARWITYYGGTNYGFDYGYSIASDSQNNLLVGGYTNSGFVGGGVYTNDFPTGADAAQGYVYTPMSPQSPYLSNLPDDAFLLKFDENGQRLFGTLFGSSDQADGIFDLAIDATDNIVVTGLSRSDDLPGAVNTYPSTTSRSSAFVSVFAPTGLISWTYYLGNASGKTRGRSVSIDNTGAIVVTGLTQANGFSTDGTTNQGKNDLFVARFTNTAAATLDWCTYFGGAADESTLLTNTLGTQNDIHQVVNDAANNIYLMSISQSDGLGTPGVYQENRVPGDGISPPNVDEYDNILVSLSSAGTVRFATYLGGSDKDGEQASGIAIDKRGDVLVTSSTLSNDIPTWPVGGYQINKNGTGESMYMAKFTNMGQLICGTYYGGDGVRVYDMEIDSKGFPVLAGSTSANFPTSASPNPPNTVFQSNNAGSTDAFILKLCSPCGETADGALIVDEDEQEHPANVSMCAGDTIILIPGLDLTNSRGIDVFPPMDLFDEVTYEWTDLSGPALLPGGFTYVKTMSANGDRLQVVPTVSGTIDLELKVSYGSCPVYKNITIDVIAAPTIDVLPADVTICPYDAPYNFVFNLVGTAPWTLDIVDKNNNPVLGIPDCAGSPCNIAFADSGCYKLVKVTDAACFTDYDEEFCLNFYDLPTATIAVVAPDDADICPGETVDLEVTFADGTPNYGFKYTKDNLPLGGLPVSPATDPVHTLAEQGAGVYKIIEVSDDNCLQAITDQEITITEHPLPALTITNVEHSNADNTIYICAGEDATIILAFTGTANYDVSYNHPINGASNLTATSGTANLVVIDAGTYTFTGIKDANCDNTGLTTSINVVVNALPTVVANTTNTNTICDGDALTLAGSGANTYVWDNGVTDNVAFNPGVTTTYEVSGTDANNCVNTDQIQVVVNPLPTVTANATSTTICDGDAVTLTGSGASSYVWDNGVTDNVAFNPSATTTYTVTGTDANNCVNTNQIQVVVNPLPTVVANATSTTICNGDAVTLSGSGANTYIWDNGVSDNVAFNPGVTTTYEVTGTDANNCVNTDQIQVVVNPLPSIVANATSTAICDGDAVTLSGSGANTYVWDNSVVDGVAFNPSATTTYTVTGTDANNCQNTGQIQVVVNPLPTVVSITEQCIATNDKYHVSITLAGGSGNYNYKQGVDITPAGLTGSFTGSTWNSNTPINSATAYAIVFYDDLGCEVTASGNHACNCISDAGTMNDLTAQTLCLDQFTTPTHQNDWVNDLDDIFTFVLSDVAVPNSAADILAWNNNGVFGFDSNTITCGTTYYLLAVAGNDLENGQADFADICLDLSAAIPVTWRCAPDASFEDSDFSACIGTNINANVLLTPNNLALNYTISAPGINGVGEVGVDPQTFVMPASNVTLTLSSVQYNDAPACPQTINKSLTITALDTLELLSVTETCNATNDKYVVRVTLLGGDINSYDFDPATIPAGLAWTFDNIDTWTSDPINSGVAYEVDFFDGNNCDIEKVNGQKTCICTSNTGTMDTTSIDVCEDVNATAIYDGTGEFLDGNDMLQFILHDGVGFPVPPIGGVMDRNALGVFAYNVIYAYNTTYYITAVVGNNVGGEVDLDDPCLNASARVPVVFRQLPDVTVSALPNDSICIGDAAELQFTFTKGVAPYNVMETNGSIDGLSNRDTRPIIPNLGQTKTYTFTSVTDQYCSSIINQSVTFTLPKAFDVTSTIAPVNCQDIDDGALSVEVTGGFGPYTYQWYDVSGDPISGEINNNIDSLAPGNYPVEITDSFGCTTTEYLSLATPPLFDIDLVAILEQICFQDSAGELNVTAPNGNRFTIDSTSNVYRPWQNSNIFLEMNFIPGTNNYLIKATDANNCEADTIINITGLTPMTWVSTPDDRFICPNTSTTLQGQVTGGNGNYTYVWDDVTVSPQQVVSPAETTSYSVYAKDKNDCPSSKTYVTVIVPDEMSMTTQSPDFLCAGNEATLVVNTNGGTGAYQPVWTNLNNNTQHTQELWNIAPDTTTSYEITVSDSCGTSLSKTLKVVVPKEVDVAFTPKDQEGCAPLEITFTKTTSIDYQNLQWNFSDGPKSTKSNPTHKWYQAGTYPVTLTIFDAYGCAYQHDDTVYVHPNAVPLFTFLPEKINAALPEIQLSNHSQIADSFIWHIDSVGIFTEAEPKITFPDYESGVYQVCLLANNQYNCPDELCKRIYAEYENMVFVPNFFTPNGDQINEGFKPVLSSQAVTFYEFMVFDRWGEMLFSSDNNQQSWDGTFKNKPAKPDTYVWKLRVRFEGEIKIRKLLGSVTIGL